MRGTPPIPFGDQSGGANAAVQRPWRMLDGKSISRQAHRFLRSLIDHVDRWLGTSGFDRGPWLAVFFASGIGLWFILRDPMQWSAAILLSLFAAGAAALAWRSNDDRANVRLAMSAAAVALAFGIAVVWCRSELVGAEPIDRPALMQLDARILDREEQPAQQRVRLVLAARDLDAGRPIKVRVNVPTDKDLSVLEEGARISLRARLMPPSPPLLPGAYDFARRAWFDGLAATGTLVGDIELIERAGGSDGRIGQAQRFLSTHVRSQLGGPSGTIAAAFASGDRGSIPVADDEAMRDAGLTHLLSISGLHVSAVIAAAYFLAMKLLALWPWLTLRVRLPLAAAVIGAGAGIGYTLLTGAEVPTVRSCLGAVLVMIALALGRDPLSLRMVAVAACVVLLVWPESLVGPSFQMSFAAVLAIVALHNAKPVREFLAPREEPWRHRMGRRIMMLFVTGLVIEIALMPIVLFHFHRTGLYGAFANVIAIPLVTFVSMPLIAVALLLDLVGLGTPIWFLVGVSLDTLLAIAHITAAQPGAVKLVPHIGLATVLVFVSGGLWLALWRGKARLVGLVPVLIGAVMLASTQAPDLLVTRDGRDVGVVDTSGRLYVLRDSTDSYARENLVELAGTQAVPLRLENWPGARCSPDFCSLPFARDQRVWHVLVSRSREYIDERELAAACEKADIVIADRWLPRSCKPRWLKADRRFLNLHGGLAITLAKPEVEVVGDSQGRHGWWRQQS